MITKYPVFDFLEAHFKEHNDIIIQMVCKMLVSSGWHVHQLHIILVYMYEYLLQVKELQKATRIIQTLCSEAKV